MRPTIELIIRRDFDVKRVAIQVDEELDRELRQSVELSDDPISLLLAGAWRGKNVVKERGKVQRIRREVAEKIAKALVDALVENYGSNDVMDGYRVNKER